jgi:hypothetical protein
MSKSTAIVWSRVLKRWDNYLRDVERLVKSPACTIADVQLPDAPGVYIFIDERGRECYVGKATRSLRNRVLSKHLSGDESHALQLAYMERFPDRLERRKFFKSRLRSNGWSSTTNVES